MDYLKDFYRDEISRTGKIQEEGMVICPHCFHEEDIDKELFNEKSLIEEKKKCAACGKTFNAEMFVCRSYYSITKKRRKGEKS